MSGAAGSVGTGRLYVVDGRWVSAASLAAVLLAGFAPAAFGWGLAGVALAAVVMVAGTVATRRRGATLLRVNNEGIEALRRDDFAAARASFGALARGVRLKSTARLALYNLAHAEMQSGEFEAAIEPLRRVLAWALPDDAAGLTDSMVRTELAIALCAGGRFEQAERAVAVDAAPDAPVAGQIGLSVARALIALGRGRLDASLEELDSTRALRLAEGYATKVALGEAIEAVALAGLGGVYRGRARRGAGLPWRAPMRAWVGRVVPGGEAALVAL